MNRFPLLAILGVLLLVACGRTSARADEKFYGPWRFYDVSYQDGDTLRTGTVNGDIVFTEDNRCKGMRIIGRISGALDGPITLKGDKLTLSAESDVTYTWKISEGEVQGQKAWVLALDNGSMIYHLFRER